ERRADGEEDLEQDHVGQGAPADSPLAWIAGEQRAAVLPDRLHGPVGPTVALAPQAAERGRRLGPCACLLGVDDALARASDREREIGVLGQRVAGDAADRFERLATERADGSRD